jgi:hypothetical protein
VVLVRLAGALFLAAGCGDERASGPAPAAGEIDMRLGLSPSPSPKIFETMRAEMSAPRHPADGGGRAWIVSVSDATEKRIALRAGDRARIRLVYEAGPLGIAAGGSLVFRVPPWWQWDPPQPLDRDAPGYTEVLTTESGPHPELFWDGPNLTMKFMSRGLAPGERLYLIYGAGPKLAQVDIYAERREQLRFEVDGDGDRVRSLIAASPRIDIAGPPAQLRVVVPTTARPGESVPVHVSVLDRNGNTGVPFAGEVRLSADAGLELPAAIAFSAGQQGRQTAVARAVSAGVFRATAVASSSELPDGLRAVSNPLLVAPDAPRLYWADLHGHSQLSDGSGTPEDYFTYARDVSGLDAAALTDHDHWGIEFLDEHPAMWDEIRAATIRFHAPGQFVTLLGYEWTSLLHGHRHILYFEDDGPVLSSFDDRYQTPHQLWDALRGRPAFTFAHHSAGGPIATNWRYRPDPALEPITEIVSVHGSSEAPDSPMPIYDPVAGNFVRDVLDDGVRLGFIGSGDSHDGQPGVSYRGMPFGFGLAAIRAEELSREEIRHALGARRVYATNGARIFLDVSIDGAPMGSVTPRRRGEPRDATLRIRVVAESALERIDLISRGEVVVLPLSGELEWSGERPIAPLRSGEYHYVRVIQRDGGAAWSSPIFAE